MSEPQLDGCSFLFTLSNLIQPKPLCCDCCLYGPNTTQPMGRHCHCQRLHFVWNSRDEKKIKFVRILYTQFRVHFSFIMQLTAMDRSLRRSLRPSAGYPQQRVSEWVSNCINNKKNKYIYVIYEVTSVIIFDELFCKIAVYFPKPTHRNMDINLCWDINPCLLYTTDAVQQEGAVTSINSTRSVAALLWGKFICIVSRR